MKTVGDIPISDELAKLQEAVLQAQSQLHSYKDEYIYVVVRTSRYRYMTHYTVNNAIIADDNILQYDSHGDESVVYTNNPNLKDVGLYYYHAVGTPEELVEEAKLNFPDERHNHTRRKRKRRRRKQ